MGFKALDRALARENNERARRLSARPLPVICFDCQVDVLENAHSVTAFNGEDPINRTYCSECARRRQKDDPRLLFDPRPWSVIERERSAA